MANKKEKTLSDTKYVSIYSVKLKKIFFPTFILSITFTILVGLSFAIQFVNKKNKPIGKNATKSYSSKIETYDLHIDKLYEIH